MHLQKPKIYQYESQNGMAYLGFQQMAPAHHMLYQIRPLTPIEK